LRRLFKPEKSFKEVVEVLFNDNEANADLEELRDWKTKNLNKDLMKL